jgi:hypothetical protein
MRLFLGRLALCGIVITVLNAALGQTAPLVQGASASTTWTYIPNVPLLGQWANQGEKSARSWADKTLGQGSADGITIAQAGCFLTSVTMLADYWGLRDDPLQMNEQINTQPNGFSGPNMNKGYSWPLGRTPYSDLQLDEWDARGGKPVDVSAWIRARINKGWPVLVGWDTHYVVAYAYTGTAGSPAAIGINDPNGVGYAARRVSLDSYLHSLTAVTRLIAYRSPGAPPPHGAQTITVPGNQPPSADIGAGPIGGNAPAIDGLAVWGSGYRVTGPAGIGDAPQNENGHVLLVVRDTDIRYLNDGVLDPLIARCQGPARGNNALLPSGTGVVALQDRAIRASDGHDYLAVAYHDPCQPGYNFSGNDTIAQALIALTSGQVPRSAAVGYVPFDALSEVNGVLPVSWLKAPPIWRDCWLPTSCSDAPYLGTAELVSKDTDSLQLTPQLFGWWTGTQWDVHWWHVRDRQGHDAVVYGRDWIPTNG